MSAFPPLIYLLPALLALAACTFVSPAGLIAASRLDPLGTPPDEIGIAVGVPEDIQLETGDAMMRIAFESDEAGSAVPIAEQVPLQLVRDTTNTVAAHAPSEIVYLASLSPEDAARFGAAQSEILRVREAGIEGTGSLSIAVIGGCYVGPALESLPASTWLKTSPDSGFVPLTRRTDVLKALATRSGDGLRAALRPC